ncbi:glycosyltransferase family protein [Azospirillum agricola]|uniref:glycosyltransferase family protein n=1 Tax=Azospirillum agricola TaxID=1720247 RepID=UPI000A0EFE95|nr:glycosyltransferase [Azospirillum agricola]SMH41073.1 Glycosyltransferase involved in cell wall bisynthesis [Azospirillum lipoferum]
MTVQDFTDGWPDGLPEPRVLFCGRSSPDYYRSPLFSRREVFAGPDCTDLIEQGRVRSLKTPAGEYDIGSLIARLPADQRPELIVVKADATRGNFPRNLDRFPGPKVLLVGDTHHLQDPVRALLRYAEMERFDLIVMDHTRHHGHFFLEAGFERVCWIAALDFALHRRAIPESFAHELTFVGQLGAFHPYRRHVMEGVVRAGLPLKTLRATPAETADIYASSAITLNCSLNGDLNLRVFEALGSGGFLLTDALPPESGLERLFEPGRHLVTYRSPGELVEAIRHYRSHPDEARAIRAAGQAHLLATQSPWVKLRQLYGAVYDGRIDPVIAIDDVRTHGLLTREVRSGRAEAYGAVQLLHLRARSLTLLVDPADSLGVAANVRDLPRASVMAHGELDALPAAVPAIGGAVRDEAVLVLPWPSSGDTDAGALLARFAGEHVVAVGRDWRARLEAVAVLAGWGFTPSEPGGVAFRRTDLFRHAEAALERLSGDAARRIVAGLLPWIDGVDKALRAAELARTIGAAELEAAALERALGFDRGHEGALIAFAKRAEADGRFADAFLAVAELARHRPRGALDAVLDELERRAGADPRVAEQRAVLSPFLSPAASLPPAGVAGGRRVLVVTNLFPPQEFGGYGRKLWEFSAELKRRGHELRILAADVPEFAKPGMTGTDDLEPFVERSLELFGAWRDGRAVTFTDPDRIRAVVRANDRKILDVARRHGSEVCLAGNVDLMTPDHLVQLPQIGVPVIHCVGNRHPGFPPDGAPPSPLYRIGPASEWVGRTLREAGFAFPAMTTLYPGARIDHFYRPFPPAFDRLRIVFASLFVNYKGPHVLANALALLHAQGVDFTCTFAGDAPDPGLFESVRGYCERQGFGGKVSYPGFLDRQGLARLFERSNVLVFPSSFEEPFGISQVEAMAAGLTVVSSGTGGSREIVRDGVDGLLFPVNDHERLAAALKGLADDPARWAALSRAGQERAFGFTVARSVDRIEATFTELLARRPG